MLIGHGVDLVAINRIAKIYINYKKQFVERILTQQEISKFNQLKEHRKIQYLATRFAGKEAFAKALGVGIGKVAFNDIGILNDEKGKPIIVLSSQTIDYIEMITAFKDIKFHISLTNTSENAFASVIIETV